MKQIFVIAMTLMFGGCSHLATSGGSGSTSNGCASGPVFDFNRYSNPSDVYFGN